MPTDVCLSYKLNYNLIKVSQQVSTYIDGSFVFKCSNSNDHTVLAWFYSDAYCSG